MPTIRAALKRRCFEFWKGRYHLFYIWQKGGHHWGHVSSTDLLHWRHHPTGLYGGMYSGNTFLNKEGTPTMCYHDQSRGNNAMALALDDERKHCKTRRIFSSLSDRFSRVVRHPFRRP